MIDGPLQDRPMDDSPLGRKDASWFDRELGKLKEMAAAAGLRLSVFHAFEPVSADPVAEPQVPAADAAPAPSEPVSEAAAPDSVAAPAAPADPVEGLLERVEHALTDAVHHVVDDLKG